MVKLVEVQVVCDQCREDDPVSRNEATDTVPVAIGGPPFYELDLCGEHAKPYLELKDFALAHGRSLKTPPAKSRVKGNTRPRPSPTDAYREGDEWRCPECSEMYASPQGLASHRRMAHGDLAPCPQCGKMMKVGGPMTHHLNKTHHLDRDQQPLEL